MTTPPPIRAVDVNNDWLFGQGRGSYRTGDPAIQQDIKTSLQCWLNDCFWRMNFGVDWANLLGARNPAAQANILLQCRQVILNVAGVTRVNAVNASIDSRTRALSIQYNVSDIFSTNVVGSVSISP